ncbi:hypothetical protein K503DRAFT_457142 [Rhizopogon vinicolor AM-OR11-026]|uniref:Uncharacterized protein n=1 Tax=Rhizopogon vinicolor AM-OR11-026 TaxID=1314800 RepID=A0A1B7NA77_9AGAM|nr:hypothetical protein K503DRAFT_457142 [Rhizopogon vinicolor AM-OR11-026]
MCPSLPKQFSERVVCTPTLCPSCTLRSRPLHLVSLPRTRTFSIPHAHFAILAVNLQLHIFPLFRFFVLRLLLLLMRSFAFPPPIWKGY